MSDIRGVRELPDGYHEVHDAAETEQHEWYDPQAYLPASVSPFVAAGVALGAVLFGAGVFFGRNYIRTGASSVAAAGRSAYGSAESLVEDAAEAVGLREPPRRRSSPRRCS